MRTTEWQPRRANITLIQVTYLLELLPVTSSDKDESPMQRQRGTERKGEEGGGATGRGRARGHDPAVKTLVSHVTPLRKKSELVQG